MLLVLILGVFGDGLNLANAYFIGYIIEYIEDEQAHWQEGVWKVCVFAIVAFSQALIRNHFINNSFMLTIKLR